MLNFIRKKFSKNNSPIKPIPKVNSRELEIALSSLNEEQEIIEYLLSNDFTVKRKTQNPVGIELTKDDLAVQYNSEDEVAFLKHQGLYSEIEATYLIVLYSELINANLTLKDLRVAPFYMQYVYGQLTGDTLISTNFEVWPYGVMNSNLYEITSSARLSDYTINPDSKLSVDKFEMRNSTKYNFNNFKESLDLSNPNKLTSNENVNKILYITNFILNNTSDNEKIFAKNIIDNMDLNDYQDTKHRIPSYLFTDRVEQIVRGFEDIYNYNKLEDPYERHN